MGRGDGVNPEGLSLQRCDRVILLPPHLPTDTARSWTSWEDEGRAAAPNPLSPCSQGPSAQEHGARAPAPGAQLSPRTYISDRNRCVGCGRQPGPGGSAGRAQRPAGGAGHGAGGQEHRSAPACPAVCRRALREHAFQHQLFRSFMMQNGIFLRWLAGCLSQP